MPEMVVALTGNNSFALRARLAELTSSFIDKYSELALERFDAEEVESQAIIDAVQNLPLLATKKMVVVRNLSTNRQAAEAIEQIIGSAQDTTDLIIYETNLDKRTSYFKVLKTRTQFEELNELDGRSLAKWLVEDAKRQGGKLSFADANYLVERLGTNQELLSNELNKLLTYDASITRQSIDLLTEPTPQSRIFDLLDAAFAGQKNRALKLYNEQRAQKVEPQAILAMIAWQLQLIVLTKYGADKSVGEVAKDSGAQPYPLKKAAALASKLEQKQIEAMVENAFELDYKSKTQTIDLDEALKTYIVTL